MTVATGKYQIFGIFVFFLRFSVFLDFLNTDFGFLKYRGFGDRPTSSVGVLIIIITKGDYDYVMKASKVMWI